MGEATLFVTSTMLCLSKATGSGRDLRHQKSVFKTQTRLCSFAAWLYSSLKAQGNFFLIFFFSHKYAKSLAKDPPHFPGNGGLECSGGREPRGHTMPICSSIPSRPPNQKAKISLIKNSLGSQGGAWGKIRELSFGCLQIPPGLAALCPCLGTRQVIPVGIPQEIQQNPKSKKLLLSPSAHSFSSKTCGVCKDIFPNPPARSHSSYLLSLFFLLRSSAWDNSQFRTSK